MCKYQLFTRIMFCVRLGQLPHIEHSGYYMSVVIIRKLPGSINIFIVVLRTLY